MDIDGVDCLDVDVVMVVGVVVAVVVSVVVVVVVDCVGRQLPSTEILQTKIGIQFQTHCQTHSLYH